MTTSCEDLSCGGLLEGLLVFFADGPEVGKQLAAPGVGLSVDAGQDVGDVAARVEASCVSGGDEGEGVGEAIGARLGPRKQPGLSPGSHRPEPALCKAACSTGLARSRVAVMLTARREAAARKPCASGFPRSLNITSGLC